MMCGFLQVLKKATIRKEQEPDFEEKRFNVTIGEDEREFDKENEFFRERSYRIIREYDTHTAAVGTTELTVNTESNVTRCVPFSEMDFREPIYG